MSYSTTGTVDIITGESGNDLTLKDPSFTYKDVISEHQEDPLVGNDTIVLELIFPNDEKGYYSRFFYFENRNVTTIKEEIEFHIGVDNVLKDFTEDK